MARISPCGMTIERKGELCDFGGLNLYNGEALRTVVGLPSGYKRTEVSFPIGAMRIAGIWVWHGVEVWVFY